MLLLESLARTGLPWVRKLLAYGGEVLSDANFERWLNLIPECAPFDWDAIEPAL